jgi:hypothetical protein
VTEVDLSQLFGQPQLSPEAEAARQGWLDAMYAETSRAFAQVQFFAPVLCGCDRRYIWGEPGPPQAGCMIHGGIQLDQEDRMMVFRPPEHW